MTQVLMFSNPGETQKDADYYAQHIADEFHRAAINPNPHGCAWHASGALDSLGRRAFGDGPSPSPELIRPLVNALAAARPAVLALFTGDEGSRRLAPMAFDCAQEAVRRWALPPEARSDSNDIFSSRMAFCWLQNYCWSESIREHFEGSQWVSHRDIWPACAAVLKPRGRGNPPGPPVFG